VHIEYKVGYFDYLLFNLVHQFMNPVLNGFLILIALLIFISEVQERSAIVGLVVAFFIYCIMWTATALVLALTLISRRSDGVLTNHILEVRDDALFEATQFNESRFFWPGVLRVVSRPGFVAIYIAQHLAHIVPARAFRSREERSRFVSLIKERIRAA